MATIKNIFEFLFGIGLFVNAFLFIPQAIKILKNKTAKNISLLTFGGFLFIQLTTLVHGIINHDHILTIGYLFTIITCGAVVILAFIYKKRSSYLDSGEITAEQIIAQLPGHVYWKNKDCVSLGCNINNWKDYGFSSLAEYTGTTDYNIFPKEQANKIRRTDLEVMETGSLKIAEEPYIAANGKTTLYLSHKVPLRDYRNKIIGILGISLDLTKEREKENERLTLLENIIALTPGHVYWKDENGFFLGCNDLQAKSAGFTSRKEMIGKTDFDMPWLEQAEALREIDLLVMKTQTPRTIEETSTLADGTESIFLSKKVPLHLGENKIGVLGISFDITEQRKTERKLQETQHKLEGMTLISATLAHEMRTPLSAFGIAADNIKVIFPRLKKAYLWAKENNAPIEDISPKYLNYLEEAFASMQREVEAASTFIDIALMNTNPSLDIGTPEILSISEVINNALLRYPFIADQKQLIQWKNDNITDFSIKSDRLLITHVLFNLIKNALYYIAKAGKGNIQIWLEPGRLDNKLFFKDTGTGIPNDVLPRIFERFFSTTDKSAHPAGVGLSFCKQVMESLKGGIACESIEGSHTLFILTFPGNI